MFLETSTKVQHASFKSGGYNFTDFLLKNVVFKNMHQNLIVTISY